MEYQADLERARIEEKENRQFLNRLKKKKGPALDHVFRESHEEVFGEIDCLACANCCKTTSPIFIPADIDRLAKALKIKPSVFVQEYLKVDEDGDYILQSSPCVFLMPDNTCMVYENRPRACREYPHTNRKRIHQIMDLTISNTLVCPAVVRIVKLIRLNS